MSPIAVSLFGQFRVSHQEQVIQDLNKAKVQELFSYLLLHRQHPHHREALATLLWEELPFEQSKRYLRKVLWQLQAPFSGLIPAEAPQILNVQGEWIQINAAADITLDVSQLENAFACCQGKTGRQLSAAEAALLQTAASVYTADLLEGWFQDWCLYTRERLQQMYLLVLDKLIDYCLAHAQYDNAIAHCFRILQIDIAHERTHRYLMQLYYLSGNRTQALRQFDVCAATLERELQVAPGRQTIALRDRIMSDKPISVLRDNGARNGALPTAVSLYPSTDPQIARMQAEIRQMESCLRRMQYSFQTLLSAKDRAGRRFE
jgi:DNA-binding SARP family transcriptional activator